MLSIAYLGLSENDLYIIPSIFMATSMAFQDIVGPMMIDEWICALFQTSPSSPMSPMLAAISRPHFSLFETSYVAGVEKTSETPGLGMASIAPNHADRNTSPMISNE